VIPNTAVVTGDEISDRVSQFLLDQNMIDVGEEVTLYYSGALLSFKKEGNFLTDRRVGAYEEIDGEMWFATLAYEEIEEVALEDPGGTMTLASVVIYPNEGEGFRLYVPAGVDGVQRFLDMLEDFRRPVLCGAAARQLGMC